MDPKENAVVTPPATIKVGDKEYTPEQIEQLEKEKSELEESKKTLQSDYSKKAQRLSELEKSDLADKADDVIAGKISATTLTDQEKEDLGYMSRLGFVPQAKLDEVIKRVQEETEKKVEDKLTKTQRLAQTEKEIDNLASQHTFIDKEQLKKYLSDRAEGGTVLSTEEAVTLLYKDQIVAAGIKPADLPGVEPSKKQDIDPPAPKILPLGSKEMGDRIRERLETVK